MISQSPDTRPSIALFGNNHQDECLSRIAAFAALLTERGERVVVCASFYDYLRGHGAALSDCVPIEAPDDSVRLVVSFGGDGTFLHAADWVGRKPIPVLGVNTGHLGFLASWMLRDASDIIDAICSGDVVVEKRSKIRVECDALPEGMTCDALNEVAILKENTSSMITVETRVDDFFLTDYKVDGLVISTPTGSTAYNLSAGGPILQPTLDAWVLSPIAPHTLTMRPLVVDAHSVVTAVPHSRSGGCLVSIDGCSFSVPSGTRLRITKASSPTLIARRPSADFASTLREKLKWGQPLRHDD